MSKRDYFKRVKKAKERRLKPKDKWRDDALEAYTPSMEWDSASQKGLDSERKIEAILVKFVAEGLIDSYRRTRKYSHDDRLGVDFFAFIKGKRWAIQVKSSKMAVDKERETNKRVWVINGQSPNAKSLLRHLIQKVYC